MVLSLMFMLGMESSYPNTNTVQGTKPRYVYRNRYGRWLHDVMLTGTASGGIVYLVDTTSPEGEYVAVKTRRGELAESVIERLVEELHWQSENQGRTGRYPPPSGDSTVQASGKMIKGLNSVLGTYAIAGTDDGLGIPRPPLFLSGRYDPVSNKVIYRWENPPGAYDEPTWRDLKSIGSNTTTRIMEPHFMGIGVGEMRIVGLRGQTPSDLGVITVGTNFQEEIRSAPFYCGVMPNWSSWCSIDGTNSTKYEQGIRRNLNYGDYPFTPDGKPFYQIVKTKTTNGAAGIWRKWLGLMPGHKYRVYVRLNTLAMDNSTNNWSLSFHVAANVPDGTAFTTDQLTGKAPLPDGSHGLDAAQMVTYGPGHTTHGGWVCSTMDIVLPPKVDTITTWLRHTGADSTGVAMDWIKVEDLGPAASNNTVAK